MGKLFENWRLTRHGYAVLGFILVLLFLLFTVILLPTVLSAEPKFMSIFFFLALLSLPAYAAFRYWKCRDFDEAFCPVGESVDGS
jgi:hypothetical protein